MSKYDVSIIGEPFLKYVGDQINVRQKVHGSGLTESNRTQQQIQYLNGRNSWVKVASSVSIDDISRLTNIGFTEQEAKSFKGTSLAQEYVLFNGTSTARDPLQRFGVSQKDNKLTGANYGTAGSDEFGLQAMPGITGFSVAHNNLGSIRTGEVTIRANSRRQFNILELLYVRLGYSILVEWGNGVYFDNDNNFKSMGQTLIDDVSKGWFAQNETTHLEFFSQINKVKKQYQGNYDAFFCKVQNFDWSFNPDGYYEIKLSLVSLGDIIESLKINNLTKDNIIPEKNPTEAQTNKSNLFNFLYCKKQFLEQGNQQGNQSKNYVSVSNTLSSTANQQTTTSNLGRTIFTSASSKQNYVRLGTFLQWLEKNIIPFYEYGDKSEPMLAINTTDRNYMRNFPGLVSTNPSICFMRNNLPIDSYGDLIGDINNTKVILDKFYLITQEVDSEGSNNQNVPTEEEANSESEFQDPLLTGNFSNSPGAKKFTDDYLGRIVNLYLNFDFIDQVLNSNKESILNQDLYSFFKSLCSGINSCFGGYINLEPIIQNEKILVIVDRNLNARTNKEGEVLNESEKSPTINMYGYDLSNNTSNFVKDFSFNTKISKDLATMIAIGATANNQSNLEVSNFFNNLNRGLVDRFAQKVIDGEKEDKKTEEEKLECASDKKPAITKKISYKINHSANIGLGPVAGGTLTTEEIEVTDEKKDGDTEYEPVLEDFWFNYTTYLANQFGTERTGQDVSRYFTSETEMSSKGSSLLLNYLKEYQKVIQYQTQDSLSLQSGMIGFIPIDINLTLDGIGGIKIYNQLVIDSRFLPQGYPEKVEFIVKGVEHKVSNNDWTTVISAISKPSPSTTFDVSLETIGGLTSAKEQEVTDINDNDITFYPPLGTLSSDIRNDSGGSGYFGAPRDEGERPHLGVDYRTKDNQIIYAPIQGIIRPTKATETSTLPGVKIQGTGQYAGIEVFMFYSKPTVALNQKIDKGAPIARSVNLQRSRGGDYSENVTNHIHFKVTKNDTLLNPELLIYSLSLPVFQGTI